MLELVIVPITLLLGIGLVYWGVNGLPGAHQIAFASGSHKPGNVERRAFDAQRAVPFDVSPPPAGVRQADLLLTDLMTEMLDIRTEITALRNKVDAMTRIEPAYQTAPRGDEDAPSPRRRATKSVA